MTTREPESVDGTGTSALWDGGFSGQRLHGLRALPGLGRQKSDKNKAADEPARALYNAESADLSDFAGHGGKLILWHGWADPHISPVGTLAYWQRLGRRMGVAQRAASVRLFLLPGMGHCDGGEGPSQFPLLAALMDWVEQSKAPDVMIAHRPANQPALVREIRAWPGLTR